MTDCTRHCALHMALRWSGPLHDDRVGFIPDERRRPFCTFAATAGRGLPRTDAAGLTRTKPGPPAPAYRQRGNSRAALSPHDLGRPKERKLKKCDSAQKSDPDE